MKKTFQILLVSIFMALPFVVSATGNHQGGGNNGNGGGNGGGGTGGGVPLDGGLSLMLIAGAGYGAKKIANSRKAIQK